MESRVLHENHILLRVPRKVDNVERMELNGCQVIQGITLFIMLLQ
jgi:hypothetical protein